MSSLSGAALPPETVYFGEVGLSGAVRPVAQAPARLKEALKLGFARAVTPEARGEGGESGNGALATEGLRHIADLVAGIAANRGAERDQYEDDAEGEGDARVSARYTGRAARGSRTLR